MSDTPTLIPPLPWTWDGERLAPLNPHWARRADAHLVIGETYTLVPHEDRSDRSHKHYFAELKDYWLSLPDRLSAEFPSPEHLRHHALIRTGYRDQRSIVCASRAEAQRVAAFLRPIDVYAETAVNGCVVVHLTAHSQSYKAMDRKTFGESKQAVLGFAADLIGVSSETRHPARAA